MNVDLSNVECGYLRIYGSCNGCTYFDGGVEEWSQVSKKDCPFNKETENNYDKIYVPIVNYKQQRE